MRARGAAERDLEIPPVANKARRRRCERNVYTFLRTYFPETFYGKWTAQRKAMVGAILTAARYGGDQAIAAPRGEGKTSIAECMILYCVMLGLVRFPVIVAATGPDAERILKNLKDHLERNELLGEDFPEVCFPIQSLEGAPQRAGSQTVNGERTHLKWAQTHVILPMVPNSKAAGSVIMTRGLDAAIRGIRVGVLRPDLVVIDDPETRESVNSETQTETREKILEQDLAGLGGPGKKLARIMLTTIMRRESLSARYTDQKQKPSWHGKRMRLVEAWPDRQDLWDEYTMLRQQGQQEGDEHARKAFAFYWIRRKQMNAGAMMANPERFVGEKLQDGTRREVSAIQHAYNLIADRGKENFDTEFQNNPPEETGPIESGITARRVQKQLSGYPRRAVPPGCTVITQGIDVRKVALHWVIRAWRPDATGYTIDYGVQDVWGTTVGSDEGVDVAIRRAIRVRMEEVTQEPYRDLEGNPVPIDLSLVDAGWRTESVYQACRELGLGIMPAMGFGKSSGCVQTRFSAPVRRSTDKKPGDGWFLSRRPKQTWLVCMDADRWKAWEHDRWMTPTNKPGTLFMWGEPDPDSERLSIDEKAHHSYSRHIVAETEIEELTKGTLIRRWKARRDANHWFDASYMADVAANMKGISLMGEGKVAPPISPVGDGKADGWFAAQKPRRRKRA
jgi:hypothetical protein